MKKLTSIFALTLLAVTAKAAMEFSNCTPDPLTFPGGNGHNDVTCPAFSMPGDTLTAVTLDETVSFTGGSGVDTVSVTFEPLGPTGVAWDGSIQVATGLRSGSASGTQSATSGVTNANFSSDFSVSITSHVDMGSVASSTDTAEVAYTYAPLTTVPEPATLPMLGLGLLALALTMRRAIARRLQQQ